MLIMVGSAKGSLASNGAENGAPLNSRRGLHHPFAEWSPIRHSVIPRQNRYRPRGQSRHTKTPPRGVKHRGTTPSERLDP